VVDGSGDETWASEDEVGASVGGVADPEGGAITSDAEVAGPDDVRVSAAAPGTGPMSNAAATTARAALTRASRTQSGEDAFRAIGHLSARTTGCARSRGVRSAVTPRRPAAENTTPRLQHRVCGVSTGWHGHRGRCSGLTLQSTTGEAVPLVRCPAQASVASATDDPSRLRVSAAVSAASLTH
jgi:hypothetical protein